MCRDCLEVSSSCQYLIEDAMQNRVAVALLASMVLGPTLLNAQDTLPAGPAEPAQALSAMPAEDDGLPIFFLVGVGYGQRFDPCQQCSSPDNIQSFTGHFSIGKYLWKGLGVGIDASAWRRTHPGTPGAASDSTDASPTTLVNQLSNASLSFSYELWHVWVRAGIGLAMGYQDLQDAEGTVSSASGKGIGYSLGGGFSLPIASMVSLAVFGNWNVGGYDLSTAQEMVQRGARHEYVELGFGLTLR